MLPNTWINISTKLLLFSMAGNGRKTAALALLPLLLNSWGTGGDSRGVCTGKTFTVTELDVAGREREREREREEEEREDVEGRAGKTGR
ncbi:hypothetical protein ACNKHK_11510 [Shigella flexneri]